MKSVLIIDDKENFRKLLKTYFNDKSYTIYEGKNSMEAINNLNNNIIDLIMLDLKLGSENGLELLSKIRSNHPLIPILLMTAYASIETAVEAMKRGASDYIQKPINFGELDIKIEKLLNLYKEEIHALSIESVEYSNIIAESSEMKQILKMSDTVASGDTTVLLLGESGTGKELIAKYIHNRSKRAKDPFIAINCAAIPSELIESELFGAEKGSYTGASSRIIGKLELANRGTVFLDEIGDLSLSAQSKLLRAIENHTIRRIGGVNNIKLDLRVISATNKNILEMTDKQYFRKDLYYRISTYPISIPPLRDHKDDIPFLVEYYMNHYSKNLGIHPPEIKESAYIELETYSWPGNIRELKNIIERAIILNNKTISTFGLEIYKTEESNLKKRRQQEESRVIKDALNKSNMNRKKAAKILGISYRSLLYKIKQYKINYKTD